MKTTKSSIIVAAALAMSGGGLATSTPSAATVDNQNTQQVNLQKANQNKKQTNNNKASPVRLTASGRYRKFLMPLTKQKFKQNRRNELRKSSKKRNKQF